MKTNDIIKKNEKITEKTRELSVEELGPVTGAGNPVEGIIHIAGVISEENPFQDVPRVPESEIDDPLRGKG